jgi:putative transposase
MHRLVKQIAGRNSRLLRQEPPTLRSRLPTLWTNSYLVATVGGATLEVVKRNVDNQRNV